METHEKKSIKDLFQNKQFMMALPVALIVVGGFCWYIFSDSAPAQATAIIQSNLNGQVPMANPDTSRFNNKLDLQQAAPEGQESAVAGGGMQRQVPGTAEPYMYEGSRYQRAAPLVPSEAQLAAADPEYNAPAPSIPARLKADRSTVTTSPMLKESDVMLADERPARSEKAKPSSKPTMMRPSKNSSG